MRTSQETSRLLRFEDSQDEVREKFARYFAEKWDWETAALLNKLVIDINAVGFDRKEITVNVADYGGAVEGPRSTSRPLTPAITGCPTS